MRTLLTALLGIALIAGIVVVFKNPRSIVKPPTLVNRETSGEINYEGVGRFKPKVEIFESEVPQVVQIEITPDGKYMLVGSLTGNITAYQKIEGVFKRQSEPFFKLETDQPGFPPEEAGLTGIILGGDFEKSGDVFLSYSFRAGKKDFRNRIMRVTFRKEGERVVGANPKQIFEANTAGGPSHQIQDGLGINIPDLPSVMVSIGEGFDAKKALDPNLEAGKLIVIDRDGNPLPESVRYPNPKIHIIGLRNAPGIAASRKLGIMAMVDTGPDNGDRFLLPQIFDTDQAGISFNWDGSEESLEKPAINPVNGTDMVLYRWSPSETPVNVIFYHNDKMPEQSVLEEHVLVVLFGRTGDTENERGRKIVLGRLTNTTQPRVSFEPFIERGSKAIGKTGNPLGLAVDPETKIIYFGDILEGKIYSAEVQ